jgi:hypothetical protein
MGAIIAQREAAGHNGGGIVIHCPTMINASSTADVVVVIQRTENRRGQRGTSSGTGGLSGRRSRADGRFGVVLSWRHRTVLLLCIQLGTCKVGLSG